MAAHERHVEEVRILEQIVVILDQAALGYFEFVYGSLSAYVDAVRHDAYLRVQGELVVGQQAVDLVEKEITADELFETPVFTLYEFVSSLTLCITK